MKKDKKFTKTRELIYELKVNQVMTKNIITVKPDMMMHHLRHILRANNISGTPVIKNNKLIGIISIEDFIKWLISGKPNCSIDKKMTRNIKTVFNDSALVEAVSKFNKFHFGRLPVVSRKGKKLLGIITKGDIIEGLLKKLEIDYHEEEIHAYRASHIFKDILADKVGLTFQYRIKGNDFKHAGECASNLKRTLQRLKFHPDIIRRTAIAVYEAEMNIIIYTKKGKITADVEPHELKIKAEDSGPGIKDIKQAMKPGYSTATHRIREMGFGAGMGLVNIKKCSDKMKINSTVEKGTNLELFISLDYNNN